MTVLDSVSGVKNCNEYWLHVQFYKTDLLTTKTQLVVWRTELVTTLFTCKAMKFLYYTKNNRCLWQMETLIGCCMWYVISKVAFKTSKTRKYMSRSRIIYQHNQISSKSVRLKPSGSWIRWMKWDFSNILLLNTVSSCTSHIVWMLHTPAGNT